MDNKNSRQRRFFELHGNCPWKIMQSRTTTKDENYEILNILSWKKMLPNTTSKQFTLRKQNTTATDCCGQLKPNLLEVELQFALPLEEQTARNACTLKMCHRIDH